MSEFEITALVLSEHDVLRRAFTALEEAEGPALEAAWTELADRLEVHAAAEESLFYPLLADTGREGQQETEHGVHDHNDIRRAVREVADAEAGSDAWWIAVRAAQESNAEHMAQEEREYVPGFREAVPQERREELGMQWMAFHDDHKDARGLSGGDADPQTVIAADVPEVGDLLEP